MQLTIIGCGDAFGSGGRYQSCYLLETSQARLMIDCGATATVGLKRAGVSLSDIDAVLISHCHGDHFAGLPFLLLGQLLRPGTHALPHFFGPVGFRDRVNALTDCLYPDLRDKVLVPDGTFSELFPAQPAKWKGLTITPFKVEHVPGIPSLAFRIEDAGRVFAFSGDSGWCPGVIDAGKQADLYLIECSTYATPLSMHLDYVTLASKLDEISAKKYVLTHLGEDMLKQGTVIDKSRCLLAEDGLKMPV